MLEKPKFWREFDIRLWGLALVVVTSGIDRGVIVQLGPLTLGVDV